MTLMRQESAWCYSHDKALPKGTQCICAIHVVGIHQRFLGKKGVLQTAMLPRLTGLYISPFQFSLLCSLYHLAFLFRSQFLNFSCETFIRLTFHYYTVNNSWASLLCTLVCQCSVINVINDRTLVFTSIEPQNSGTTYHAPSQRSKGFSRKPQSPISHLYCIQYTHWIHYTQNHRAATLSLFYSFYCIRFWHRQNELIYPDLFFAAPAEILWCLRHYNFIRFSFLSRTCTKLTPLCFGISYDYNSDSLQNKQWRPPPHPFIQSCFLYPFSSTAL